MARKVLAGLTAINAVVSSYGSEAGSEGSRPCGGRQGGDDLDIFGQTASAQVKRGTARQVLVLHRGNESF